jgi:hypothetical protein
MRLLALALVIVAGAGFAIWRGVAYYKYACHKRSM